MITIYKSNEDSEMIEVKEPDEGCWIQVCHPTGEELEYLAEITDIDPDDLKAPLDIEERSRLELENDYRMVLVDIPFHDEEDHYETMPLGIYLTKKLIVTICLVDTPILRAFANKRVKEFFTFKRTRFLFQILYKGKFVILNAAKLINIIVIVL